MEANDRDDSFVSKFCLLFNYYPKMKNNVILILMDGLSVGILSVSLMHILPK